jgi:hypothetical protein
MHKVSGVALPVALILAGVGGLGSIATSTHARIEPGPSAASSAFEHQLHCAPPVLPLGPGVWQDQHMNCSASPREGRQDERCPGANNLEATSKQDRGRRTR